MGLRLLAAKTRICPVDDGFDFFGFRAPSDTAEPQSPPQEYMSVLRQSTHRICSPPRHCSCMWARGGADGTLIEMAKDFLHSIPRLG